MIITDTTLAPEPGTHTVPGPGANAAFGHYTPPPGILDPPRTSPAAAAFIRARDGYLVTREYPHQPDRSPDLLTGTSLDPGAYDRWLDSIWPAAACAHPIRLTGYIRRVDAVTGEVLSTLFNRYAARPGDLQGVRQPPRRVLPGLR